MSSGVNLNTKQSASQTEQLAHSAKGRRGKADQADKAKSLFSIFAEQFAEHRVAMASLVFLLIMITIAAFAPFITNALGVNPIDQNISNRYAPAGSVTSLSVSAQEVAVEKWVDENADKTRELILKARQAGLATDTDSTEDIPFIINEKRRDATAEYEKFVALGGSAVESYTDMISRFESRNLLGTDDLGRDVLSRIIYGARISLMVAGLVGFFSMVLGLLFGATAGYFGGTLDNILMRITDALLTIPTLPLYIIFAAADLTKIPVVGDLFEGEHQSIVKMVVVMASLTWMPIARIVRGTVLSIKESEYVMAARTIGMSDFSIIIGHVVPNVFGPLVVAVTLLMGDAMLIETGLSFLGLGIQPPMPSWGNMLQNAIEIVRSMPSLAIIPGLMIFLVIIAINFVGDGLRDALDPKAIRR